MCVLTVKNNYKIVTIIFTANGQGPSLQVCHPLSISLPLCSD